MLVSSILSVSIHELNDIYAEVTFEANFLTTFGLAWLKGLIKLDRRDRVSNLTTFLVQKKLSLRFV